MGITIRIKFGLYAADWIIFCLNQLLALAMRGISHIFYFVPLMIVLFWKCRNMHFAMSSTCGKSVDISTFLVGHCSVILAGYFGLVWTGDVALDSSEEPPSLESHLIIQVSNVPLIFGSQAENQKSLAHGPTECRILYITDLIFCSEQCNVS